MSLRPRSVQLALVLTSIITISMPPSTIHAQRPDGLKIVVIEGENAVNIVQQRTAVAPVVEVRDRNDQPVAGAVVTFAVRGGRATFSGARTLSLTTNAAGRAAVTGLTPTGTGTVQITASTAFQGQTAAATITQSNVMTAADAGQMGPRAKTGGSAAKIVGIVGAVAAGGAVAAISAGGSGSGSSSAQQSSTVSGTQAPGSPPTSGGTVPAPAPSQPAPLPNRAPIISSASVSPNVALVGTDTPISFQVQASDPDDDPLTLLWEFPDGTRSDQRAFSRTFQHGGLYLIRVTVTDGKTAASSEMTLNMKTMTGDWNLLGTSVLSLTQNGTTVSGTWSAFTAVLGVLTCPVMGTIRSVRPTFVLDLPHCPHSNGGFTRAIHWEFDPSSDFETFVGRLWQFDLQGVPATIVRKR